MLRFLRSLIGRSTTPHFEEPDSRVEQTAAPFDDIDDDLSWLDPPLDIHDVAAWDRYWYGLASHGISPAMFDLFARDQALVDEMLKHNLSTVLCAGSGISQEPRALAYAGMKVTALDSSPTAMELARSFPADDEYLQRFFERPEKRAGGWTEFEVGDFRDTRVCAGPYDVVIERCTIQLFPDDERSAALDALAARLAPGGIFFSHCHFGSWAPDEPLEHPAEPWFVNRRFTICNVMGQIEQEWPGIGESRSAWLFMSTG